MTGIFTGEYVHDIVDAAAASILSHSNLVVLSEPGFGKTFILKAIAIRAIQRKYVLIPVDPSTPPERIKGQIDFAEMINNNRQRMVLDDTAFDPNADIVLIDEGFRGSDILFDNMIHAFLRSDIANPDDAPIFWMTSNFAPKNDRSAAMRDRIPLWVWLNPGEIDIREMVKQQLMSLGQQMDVGNGIPTIKEAREVWKMIPGDNANNTIQDFMENLKNELSNISTKNNGKDAKSKSYKFEINPRRSNQISQLLYRVNSYYMGAADWTELKSETTRLIRWCYPLPEKSMAMEWEKIAQAVSDIVGAAITRMFEAAKQRLQDIKDRGVKSGKTLISMSPELGLEFSNCQKELYLVGKGDDRVKKAIQELTRYYADIIGGKA